MAPLRQSVPAAPEAAFVRLRTELDLPGPFPPEVLAAAEVAARRSHDQPERIDATHLPMVTVDPPGSRDLDQALHVEHRSGGGLRAWYAIVDLASFVDVGDAIDREALARGRTIYLPDGSVPLHPRVLSEDAASLRAGQDRPALLWRVDLDTDGEVVDHELQRAMIRSRARLDYDEAQAATVEPGTAAAALLELGRVRAEREWVRGGVSLGLPDQRVDLVDGVPVLRLRDTLPIEDANAQLSLLVGAVAAGTMVEAGVGILRTWSTPATDDVELLRADARALGAPWPAEVDHPTFLRTLHAGRARDAALLAAAVRRLRGAGYQLLGPQVEAKPHAAVAAHYAHVTAPLRRLVDRYAHEALLAAVAGRPVDDDVARAMAEVPRAMELGGGRAARAEAATTDLAEAVLLAERVGDVLRAVPVRRRSGGTEVWLTEPAAVVDMAATPPLGVETSVRVVSVDVEARVVTLEPV